MHLRSFLIDPPAHCRNMREAFPDGLAAPALAAVRAARQAATDTGKACRVFVRPDGWHAAPVDSSWSGSGAAIVWPCGAVDYGTH
jgi:hypothetical protein